MNIEETLTKIGNAANFGCGLNYELYEQRLFNSIDSLVESLPEIDKEKVIKAANAMFEYKSREEREADLQENGEPDWKEGLCTHLFHPDECPLGCGSL